MVYVVLLNIWDSGCQHCNRSHSSKSLAGRGIQFSVVLIGYLQFVIAFFLLLSLVEMCLIVCCLWSTEYGPFDGGCFRANFCNSAIYLLLIVSVLFHAVPVGIL